MTDRPVLDLGELDDDTAPYVEVRNRPGGGCTVYLGDGLRVDVGSSGRVTLRANNHTMHVTHVSNAPLLDHNSRVHVELTRKEET